jgi:transposase-like protein
MALRVRIPDEGLVWNKAVYTALGVQVDGTKDILGLYDRKKCEGV